MMSIRSIRNKRRYYYCELMEPRNSTLNSLSLWNQEIQCYILWAYGTQKSKAKFFEPIKPRNPMLNSLPIDFEKLIPILFCYRITNHLIWEPDLIQLCCCRWWTGRPVYYFTHQWPCPRLGVRGVLPQANVSPAGVLYHY